MWIRPLNFTWIHPSLEDDVLGPALRRGNFLSASKMVSIFVGGCYPMGGETSKISWEFGNPEVWGSKKIVEFDDLRILFIHGWGEKTPPAKHIVPLRK